MSDSSPLSLQKQPVFQQANGLLELLFGPRDPSGFDSFCDSVLKVLTGKATGQQFAASSRATATQGAAFLQMQRNTDTMRMAAQMQQAARSAA